MTTQASSPMTAQASLGMPIVSFASDGVDDDVMDACRGDSRVLMMSAIPSGDDGGEASQEQAPASNLPSTRKSVAFSSEVPTSPAGTGAGRPSTLDDAGDGGVVVSKWSKAGQSVQQRAALFGSQTVRPAPHTISGAPLSAHSPRTSADPRQQLSQQALPVQISPVSPRPPTSARCAGAPAAPSRVHVAPALSSQNRVVHAAGGTAPGSLSGVTVSQPGVASVTGIPPMTSVGGCRSSQLIHRR